MKNLKKLLSLVLALVMVLGMVCITALAEEETTPEDNTTACETCGKNPCECEEPKVCETCKQNPCVCPKDGEDGNNDEDDPASGSTSEGGNNDEDDPASGTTGNDAGENGEGSTPDTTVEPTPITPATTEAAPPANNAISPAAEGESNNDNGIMTAELNPVAMIGEVEYTDLQTAFSSTQDGDTIKLVADVNLGDGKVKLNSRKGVTRSITFDLDGHTLTGNVVANHGTLTITGNGTIISTAVGEKQDGNAVQTGYADATVNIMNGTVIAEVSAAYCFEGTINIYDGTFKFGGNNNYDYKYLLNIKDDYVGTTAAINVYGGEFEHFDPRANAEKPQGSFVAPTATTVETEPGKYTVRARTEEDADAVAKIGNAVYASLQAAVDAVPENGTATIVMTADSNLPTIIPAGKIITLNVPEGVTLSNKNGNLGGSWGNTTLQNHGILTITGGGTVQSDMKNNHVLKNFEGATANLNGCTFKTTVNDYVIWNLGTMTIDGANVDNTDASNKDNTVIYNGWRETASLPSGGEITALLTIKSGTIASNTSSKNAILNTMWATLVIEGGNISAPRCVGNYDIAEIKGGTFTVTGNGSRIVLAAGGSDSYSRGQLTITGGTFLNTSGAETANVIQNSTSDGPSRKTSITGGTFFEDVQSYCASGYTTQENGNNTWTVIVDESKAVARIGDVKYLTLQAAFDAAKDGETVTLLADVTEDATLNRGKSVTLDATGHTVEATLMVNSGTLTVTGGTFDTTDRGNAGTADHCLIAWNSNAKIIVDGGTFKAGCTVAYAADGGDIEINGGDFSAEGEWGTKYLLNLKDNTTSNITVKGGTFHGYDPSNSSSENPVGNFVAEGYQATENNGTWTVAVIPAPTPTTPSVTYYTLTVNYVYADGTTAAPSATRILAAGSSYSVESPAIEGYTPDLTVVAGTLNGNDTLTVTYTADAVPEHTVTVRPVDENGAPIGGDVAVTVPEGEEYTVAVPEIDGYTTEQTVVAGTMGTEDTVVTVTYSRNSDIDDENPPLVEDPDPEDPGEVDIGDGDTPLVDNPDEKDPGEEIPDEETPKTDVPQTGDFSKVWYAVLILSACGLVLLNLKRRKVAED